MPDLAEGGSCEALKPSDTLHDNLSRSATFDWDGGSGPAGRLALARLYPASLSNKPSFRACSIDARSLHCENFRLLATSRPSS